MRCARFRLTAAVALCCAALMLASCARTSTKPSAPTPAETQTRILLDAIERGDAPGALAAIRAGAILNVELDPRVAAEREREIEDLLTESARRVADQIGMNRDDAAALQRNAIKMPAHAGPYSSEIPLHWAVRHDRVEIVAALLGAGAYTEHLDSDGRTALSHVRSVEMTRTLLSAGANPRATDSSDDDVFDHVGAVSWGWFEADEDEHSIDRPAMARLLLDAGAPLERASDGASRLWRAAFNQSSRAVDLLLDLGHTIAANEDEFGEWPLHAVCWHMDSDEDTEGGAVIERIIRALVKAGHAVNAVDADGDTPLHMAVSGDGPSVSAIGTLLELGADPIARNKNGKTALDMYEQTDGDTRGKELIEAALRNGAGGGAPNG